MKWEKNRYNDRYVVCSCCGHIQDYKSNFCPSCGEKSNDTVNKTIFVVTYWDVGLEPFVTVFDNQENAEKCYLFFERKHDGCCIDEVPICKHFGKTGE